MELSKEFIRGCSLAELNEVRNYLEQAGFCFSVYTDQQAVYYSAMHDRDVVFADVREAWGIAALREMYTECLAHL